MRNLIISLLMITTGILAAESCPAIERGAVIIGSRVQMHESASGDSAPVGLVNEGAPVAIVGRQLKPTDVGNFSDYWYLVAYRGKTGWVFGQFLQVSSGGRGLARIFSPDERIDYCDHAAANLIRIKDARIYDALVDDSGRLAADIKEMSEDPILSGYSRTVEPYRVFAAWSLAVGYAGIGNDKEAVKVREQLLKYDRGTVLPDKTTLGARIDDLNKMIEGKEKPSQ